MKRIINRILTASVILLASVSCLERMELETEFPSDASGDALVLSPSVKDGPVVTRAVNSGIAELGELAINTLDVYVYKKGTSSNTFFKRYHFVTAVPEGETAASLAAKNVKVVTAQGLTSGTDVLLESNWRAAGYDQTGTEQYRIYSIANSRLDGDVRWTDLSETALRAETSTSAQTYAQTYDIVRLKNETGPTDSYDLHIASKDFLMDGMIDNWQPDPAKAQQHFTKESDLRFDLTRAAAKFKVKLTFKPEFIERLHSQDITISGLPQLKFSNFMPETYEVTPDATPLGQWRDSRLWVSQYRYNFPETNPTPVTDYGSAIYNLTTYGYSFSWSDDADGGAGKAPSLTVSVGYKDAAVASPEYNYYRIPLVDVSKNTAVERNHLYIVEAEISSLGGAIDDIDPTDVVLKYKVIPWFHNSEDETDVEGAELLYFTADTTFTLRGENVQSTSLDYFTPKSEMVSGHYLFEPKISNVQVYYKPDPVSQTFINRPSNRPGTYSNDNRKWQGQDVTISVVPNPSGGGEVQVSSTVLANRAVKYIEFDATVTFTITDPDTGVTSTSTVTHHYLIKHFPLDNIQSVLGAWSSRWDGSAGGETVKYYRKRFRRQTTGWVPTDQESWAAGIGNSNADRMSAQSPETAVNGFYATGIEYTTTENRYNNPPRTSRTISITWSGRSSVSIAETSGSNRRTWTINMPINLGGIIFSNYVYFDYVSSYTQGTANLVKYSEYYNLQTVDEYSYNPTADGWDSYIDFTWEECTQAQYNATSEENRKSETVQASPGVLNGWVDWDIAYNSGYMNGNTGRTCYDDDENITFYAKYWGSYYNSSSYVYNISYNNNSYSGTRSDLTNNHMYIIQISKADNTVALGHPVLDGDKRSNDNVVSPAFMIASQLGAVRVTRADPYTEARSLRAASHCATYMEVGRNGRRYTGWRLPTQAELKFISDYQDDDSIANQGVFSPVVTGHYYYTLNPRQYSN
ncbi:MAG: hypothetical protein J6N54_08845, partial [Bacteroidales bacterium]|nr:hypothetical protein [Bacteroidales bacterium]